MPSGQPRQHIQLFALTAGLFCYIERFSCLSGRSTVIRGAFCHFERGEKSGQQIPPVAVLPRKDSLFAGAPRKNKQGGAACPVLLCRSLVSRRTGSAGGAVPACARGAASVYPGTLQMASGHSAGAVPQGGRPAGYAVQGPHRDCAGTVRGYARAGPGRGALRRAPTRSSWGRGCRRARWRACGRRRRCRSPSSPSPRRRSPR